MNLGKVSKVSSEMHWYQYIGGIVVYALGAGVLVLVASMRRWY